MINAWKQWLTIAILLILAGCNSSEDANLSTLKVGVYAVEDEETPIVLAVKKNGISNGLNIIPIIFRDYRQLNMAVCQKRLDANVFQTLPYFIQQTETDPLLQQVMQQTNCQLEVVGKTFIYPIGLYSRRLSGINQIQPQSVVAIPAQPINSSRALLLLEQVGLIGLRPGAGVYSTVDDIVSNPLQLVIVPMPPDQLPTAMGQASLAALNPVMAAEAGLSVQNAFVLDTSPEYAVLIVARKEDADKVQYAELVSTYHSSGVVSVAEQVSNGGAVPAWVSGTNELPGMQE